MSSYRFEMRDTDCECHVTMTSPGGHVRRKRFRNGYSSSRCTAKRYIASQIQTIETECKLSKRKCPDIFVDGVQVVSSDPPTMREMVAVLKRITEYVRDRGPDSGDLFEASCDAEQLLSRHELSLMGEFIPAGSIES